MSALQSALQSAQLAAARLQRSASPQLRWRGPADLTRADLAELSGLLGCSCEALHLVLGRFALRVRIYWARQGGGNAGADAWSLHDGIMSAAGHAHKAEAQLAEARSAQRAVLAAMDPGTPGSVPSAARMPQLTAARQLRHALRLAEDTRHEQEREALASTAETLALIFAALHQALAGFARAVSEMPGGYPAEGQLDDAAMHCQEAGPHLTTVKAFLRTNRLRATA